MFSQSLGVCVFRPWGPFLESPETFRAHFGWHNSLCIFKAKASRDTNLCSYFNFYSLHNIWKDQLYGIRGSQLYEWLFGPKKFSGLSRNGPQATSLDVAALRVSLEKKLESWRAHCHYYKTQRKKERKVLRITAYTIKILVPMFRCHVRISVYRPIQITWPQRYKGKLPIY